MYSLIRYLLSLLLAFSLLATPGMGAPCKEQGEKKHMGWHEPHSSHEQAREAVEHGRALPLPLIRHKLRMILPGKIVSTHYEEEHGRRVYGFKVIDTQGQLLKVHMDAYTGELLEISDY